MSELKGQILGVIITLGLFGTISAVMTAVVTNLNNKIKNEAKSITGTEVVVNEQFGNLLHY